MNEKQEHLLRQLGIWLASHGYKQGRNRRLSEEVLGGAVFRRPGAPALLVEAKVADAYRSQVFPAMVGDAILRFDRAAEKEELLLAFLLGRISRRAIADIEKYAKRFRPDLNWFVIDEAGNGFARLHDVAAEVAVEPLVADGQLRGAGAPRGSMFSANNQWLLKVLLLHGLDVKYWGGPRAAAENIVDLARISGVPQPSVSKFVARFEEAGYLHRAKRGLRVRRHRELLNDWFHADKHGRLRAVGVRSLYGEESEEDLLDRIKAYCDPQLAAHQEPPVAVSHHLACHLLGVGRSNIRSVLLHAGAHLKDLMSALGLIRDESDAPAMSIRSSRSSASVFRGVVLSGGVPICDILQCYLDVRASRARGEEQAQYILDKVLMPYFGGES